MIDSINHHLNHPILLDFENRTRIPKLAIFTLSVLFAFYLLSNILVILPNPVKSKLPPHWLPVPGLCLIPRP